MNDRPVPDYATGGVAAYAVFDAGIRKSVTAWLARGRWGIYSELILRGARSDLSGRWPLPGEQIEPTAVLPGFAWLREGEIRYSEPEYHRIESTCLIINGESILYANSEACIIELCLLVVGEGWRRDPRLGA